MFYNLLLSMVNGIRAFTNDAANYLKCRAMCCNNINVYNPKSCCFQGDILNRWVRTTTPGVESPIRRNTTEKFFTPKNSK